MNTGEPLPVAAYLRISRDEEDEGLGVARQQKDCAELAERKGWRPVYFVDNNVSAFKVRDKGTAFEAMFTALEDGSVGGLIVYDLDRFSRQPADLERLIKLYDRLPGLVFATVTNSELDLTTDDARFMARLLVNVASKASADTRRRTKRKHLELAEAGKPVGGRRPFGYEDDKVTLNEPEAEAIRRVCAELLSGKALRSVAAQLNADGMLTPWGKPWQHSVLKRTLVNPRLVGLRTYKREVLRDSEGELVRGTWEPLLDEDTWQAVVSLLRDPERGGSSTVHSNRRRYLLSGLLTCGASGCGGTLNGCNYKVGNRHNYTCDRCNAVSIHGPKADELAEALTRVRLADESAEAAPADESWSGEDELSAMQDRITELLDAHKTGALPADIVFPQVQALSAERKALEAQRGRWQRESAEAQARHDAATVENAWENLDIDQRRELVRAACGGFLVTKAPRRGAPFTQDRLIPAR